MQHDTTEAHPQDETITVRLAQYADSAVHGAECCTAKDETLKSEATTLMECVVERSNLLRAYAKVLSNKGASGVDNVNVHELKTQVQTQWQRIKTELLNGTYRPQAVRSVSIPKPNGGTRTLGIPTVMDRLIQQALLQILQPIFEPTFSGSSYGFRPGRNAWQAVKAAQTHIQSGKTYVVDMDLEKFFDRVNHDILMSRVARTINDKRVLKLIRKYLQAGMMEGGLVSARHEGTPQGGPLSPLLSNILLTDLDRELEKRGHAFCRYADDCNIYVGSEKGGQRVLASITRYLETTLKLTVNAQKSAVAKPSERKFLGYSFSAQRKTKVKIAESSIVRLKTRIGEVFDGAAGRALSDVIAQLTPKLRGWASYFRLTEIYGELEELDQWLRRKCRTLIWRQAKRGATRKRMLLRRGLAPKRAHDSTRNGRGSWWNGGASHMNAAFPKNYFDAKGLVSLLDTVQRFQRGL
ncbi:MAG: group II intron reverse transcriptase/maturase [Pseudomonadota bacterium]